MVCTVIHTVYIFLQNLQHLFSCVLERVILRGRPVLNHGPFDLSSKKCMHRSEKGGLGCAKHANASNNKRSVDCNDHSHTLRSLSIALIVPWRATRLMHDQCCHAGPEALIKKNYRYLAKTNRYFKFFWSSATFPLFIACSVHYLSTSGSNFSLSGFFLQIYTKRNSAIFPQLLVKTIAVLLSRLRRF
jgi:hypothetical protein